LKEGIFLNVVFKYAVVILGSYLIGCMNPAYLMAKLKGYDIRQKGSGNAGASNALILFGKLRGVICAVADIGKAVVAVCLMGYFFEKLPLVYPLSATACILGHIFPFYMGFRGGKGLACLAGVILCYDWKFFLLALAVEIVVALVTDYICFVPLTAAVAFPICYIFMKKDIWGTLTLLIASAVMIYRHTENLKRIKSGAELRLSYLWKKEQEIERLRENTGKSEKDYFIDPQ